MILEFYFINSEIKNWENYLLLQLLYYAAYNMYTFSIQYFTLDF